MNSMRYGTTRFLPQFIKAKSPAGLHNKIKKLQRKDGVEYRFINMYFDASKQEHVAWYYTLLSEQQELNEVINELATE